MIRKRLGHDEDTAPRLKDGVGLRTLVGIGGEAVIELMQPCDCGRAVSLREGRECGVELGGRPEARSHSAEVDDLRSHRQRRQQSRALQWLGLIRHCREPTDHAVVPIL
jgi:hypothetical protein